VSFSSLLWPVLAKNDQLAYSPVSSCSLTTKVRTRAQIFHWVNHPFHDLLPLCSVECQLYLCLGCCFRSFPGWFVVGAFVSSSSSTIISLMFVVVSGSGITQPAQSGKCSDRPCRPGVWRWWNVLCILLYYITE
jgi:hypothetical protein